MDALPIQEQTGLDFSSEKEGVSHSCGHDIHTVIALYCTKLLQERRMELKGNVRVVFQPAEENAQGAKAMVKSGIMQQTPLNDYIIGLHTHPQTPVGKIRMMSGPMEAASDYITIRVNGRCGHGAYPHDCVDSIIVSAYLITQLQTVVSRENRAVKPVVFTIGSIHGGQAHNSIPGSVTMLGTLRTLYPETREACIEAIRRITKHVCEAMRAEGIVEVSEEAALPAVCNDPEVVRGLTESAKRVLGEDSVLTLDFPSMGSDDFSIFLKYARGAQFFLGTGNKNDNSRLGLHNGKNIFDERCLTAGVAVLTDFVLNQLK